MMPAAISLRAAEPADEELIFSWRNRPEIVALGSSNQTVERAAHGLWFAESLTGAARSLYVIEADGRAAGQIRFDWREGRQADVSIYLLAEFTGHGLGVNALREGCRLAFAAGRADCIVARIRKDNARSRSAFRKAGFVAAQADEPLPGHETWLLVHQPAPYPIIPHNRLTFGAEEELAVQRVVRSGRWTAGAELRELERRLAHTAGVAHAVGVGSGLGALRLALLALGVGTGDLVAVPAYACVALANAVLACGAAPVPVDVDASTWTISVDALRTVLTTHPKIRVAIAVHTFGCPAPVRAIQALGVQVVEDCSHAIGVAPFGTLGRVAILSLYATKLLGAGEGGMILTQDAAIADRVRNARDYADQAPASWRLNDKMTDLTAALGLCQLERLPASLSRRAKLARRYSARLAEIPAHGCVVPGDEPGRVWYRYTLAVPDAADTVARLAAVGVVAARPVEDWGGTSPVLTPVAGRAFQQLVSLPLYPTLTEAEQDRVCTAVSEALAISCAA